MEANRGHRSQTDQFERGRRHARDCKHIGFFPQPHGVWKWIPDAEPHLDWSNQSPALQAPEIRLDDGRISVLEYT